ncbi:MAG: hypothetical protein H0T92_03515 [Pyrinomonadaceae bacterium]|nr:hypothetical protein [Pyrinomonadaceae bacterium]
MYVKKLEGKDEEVARQRNQREAERIIEAAQVNRQRSVFASMNEVQLLILRKAKGA